MACKHTCTCFVRTNYNFLVIMGLLLGTLVLGNSLLHIFGVWLFEAAAWTGKDRNGLSLISKRPSSSVADIQELMKLHQRVIEGSFPLPYMHSSPLLVMFYTYMYLSLSLSLSLCRLKIMRLAGLKPLVVCVTFSLSCRAERTCCVCTSHVFITVSQSVSLTIQKYMI